MTCTKCNGLGIYNIPAETCWVCRGSGVMPSQICGKCNGSGLVKRMVPKYDREDGHMVEDYVDFSCQNCNGSGKIIY
jgi:DnaJ-class molecular chaperone